ncbi:Nicotianamine aminotransferase B [Hibiscus syriacus]|uniref:Nicotianamine aminotransferase B n=1 Tax=Hibiscus syriacus TaxID=106335 RepID=A0A6A2XRB5_HIBSY|nr:Nicotianamine aminotransferase B [Hibiscus syriacus]
MENGTVNHEMETASTVTIKGILSLLMQNVDGNNCQRLSSLADDVFITSGCTQSIDVAALAMLARPGANILIPRPGFPIYELCATFRRIEIRYFDLPEKGWEVDLDLVEALADQNTVSIVIINPGNPFGNVYSYQHLEKIAETTEKLKIPVIADEVYGHLVFGHNQFVPMGVFGSIVPVLNLGSLSKRWIVPGWRLGLFFINDPSGMFKNPKIIERIKKYFDILGGPATFIQVFTVFFSWLSDGCRKRQFRVSSSKLTRVSSRKPVF